MWVTQTYLENIEPNAKVFVYYLFEDYSQEQKEFTERIQIILGDIGVLNESNVSLFMPNPTYAARIEAELRGIENLWWSMKGKLPGILVSNTPLSEYDIAKGDNYHFFSFSKTSPRIAADVIQDVKRLIDDQLAYNFKNRKSPQVKSFAKRLYEAIEAKPGVFGFTIDLKRLLREYTK